MATVDKFWQGNDPGNEGDPNTAANWLPSGVPTLDDNVYYNDSSVTNCLGHASALNTALNSFEVAKGYTGTIGSSGLPLTVIATHVDFHGGGKSYIEGTIVKVNVDTSNKQDNAFNIGGTIALLSVFSGTCHCIAGATFTDIVASYSAQRLSDHKLIIPATCVLTNVKIDGGEVTLDEDVTNLYLSGGRLISGDTAAVDITTMFLMGIGTFEYHKGDITTAHWISGFVDASRDGSKKTITTLNAYPGVKGNMRNNAKNIIATTFHDWGADLDWDRGYKYALTID